MCPGRGNAFGKAGQNYVTIVGTARCPVVPMLQVLAPAAATGAILGEPLSMVCSLLPSGTPSCCVRGTSLPPSLGRMHGCAAARGGV